MSSGAANVHIGIHFFDHPIWVCPKCFSKKENDNIYCVVRLPLKVCDLCQEGGYGTLMKVFTYKEELVAFFRTMEPARINRVLLSRHLPEDVMAAIREACRQLQERAEKNVDRGIGSW